MSQRQMGLSNSFIFLSVLGRLLPHSFNFTPLGAAALVGGAKLDRFWRWLTPLLALLLSDILLQIFWNTPAWSFTTPFVYTSFLMNILLGRSIQGKKRYLKLGLLAPIASLQFFIITNFGVWLEGLLYPKTFEGLMTCYTMALPFLTNTLAGDLLWSFGLFAAIDAVQLWLKKQALQRASV